MGRRFGGIILFLFLLRALVFAQNDSSYTDTVIIHKAPLIIKQQVFVSVPVYTKRETSLDAGLYYSLNKNVAPSSSSVTGAFQSTGFQVRYHEGNIEIGTGIGILTSSVTYNVQEQSTQQVMATQIVTKIDSQSCSTVIDPWGVVTECNKTYDTSLVLKTVNTPYEVQKKTTLYYLQIPLSIGYIFRKDKWVVTPTLQLMYNKRLGKTNEDLLQKSDVWMAGLQFSIGRVILPNLTLEVKAQYQSNLSAIYSAASFQQDNWKLLGLGLGVYYRF
jgi:hypothetical protein